MSTIKQSKIVVLIACHKPYELPQDACYLPVEVGAALHDREIPGLTPDNTGDNISAKNKSYCELTGLYWAWKNLDADYIGLVHYRRYFSNGHILQSKKARILSGEALRKELSKCDVLLPKPRHYWIETNYSQYAHAHHAIDLDTTRVILAERHPDYLPAFDASMKRAVGHRFNMFVMRCDLLDAYCTWLFDVLFELEKRTDVSAYSDYDARVFGFVAERLLDVWIETNHIPYAELPVLNTENQHWLRKGARFVMRKLAGGKNDYGHHSRI